eukprot:6203926-Pleurochrysis_carterae.AAC.1
MTDRLWRRQMSASLSGGSEGERGGGEETESRTVTTEARGQKRGKRRRVDEASQLRSRQSACLRATTRRELGRRTLSDETLGRASASRGSGASLAAAEKRQKSTSVVCGAASKGQKQSQGRGGGERGVCGGGEKEACLRVREGIFVGLAGRSAQVEHERACAGSRRALRATADGHGLQNEWLLHRRG